MENEPDDEEEHVEPAPTPMKLVKRGKRLVANPETSLPPLSADDVRDTLERTRR